MATIQQANPKAEWRKRYRRASFGGAKFHVEQQSRSSGMRAVVHEYPKRRDGLPYTEIMGKHAVRYQVTGYCIQSNQGDYHLEKEQLVAVLERPEAAALYDPYLAQTMMAVCERYSVSETRERGGYCTFEMTFVEYGTPGNQPTPNTAQQLNNQANATGTGGSNTLNNAANNYVSGGLSGLVGGVVAGVPFLIAGQPIPPGTIIPSLDIGGVSLGGGTVGGPLMEVKKRTAGTIGKGWVW